MDTLSIIIQGVLSLLLGSGAIVSYMLYRKSTMRTKDAEADMAETQADSARWDLYQRQLDYSAETIKKLESQLADKTERIRELNTELLNAVRDSSVRIVELTEERDHEKMLRMHFAQWRCERSDCKDPRKRLPPNPTIEGQTYVAPTL